MPRNGGGKNTRKQTKINVSTTTASTNVLLCLYCSLAVALLLPCCCLAVALLLPCNHSCYFGPCFCHFCHYSLRLLTKLGGKIGDSMKKLRYASVNGIEQCKKWDNEKAGEINEITKQPVNEEIWGKVMTLYR